MNEFAQVTPFGDEPLDDVHLAAAPLARVVAESRFPQLASMADGTLAHAFAGELGDEYPLFEETREVSLVIAGPSVSQQEQTTSPVWRFRTADERWRVALGRTSLSLETDAYVGRRDFCERFDRLVTLFAHKAKPPRFERLGIRYVNRVTEPAVMNQIPQLVRSEILGPAAIQFDRAVTLVHSLTELHLRRDDKGLLARCGVLPSRTTIDPIIVPMDVPSWILDIDASMTGPAVASVDGVREGMLDLAEHAYRFFRYAVSRDFLSIFEA